MRLLPGQKKPHRLFLSQFAQETVFLLYPSQISSCLKPLWSISLPDRPQKAELQRRAQPAVPCHSPVVSSLAQYCPSLGEVPAARNSHLAGGKAKVTPCTQSQMQCPPDSLLSSAETAAAPKTVRFGDGAEVHV